MQLEFENVVLYSAIVLLIVLLVFVGVIIQYSKASVVDGNAQQCPDNFVAMPIANGSTGPTLNSYNFSCQIPTGLTTAFSATSQASANIYNKGIPANLHYSSSDGTINFSDAMWSGKQGLCNKYQWATNNGYTASGKPIIDWDGITNARSPC